MPLENILLTKSLFTEDEAQLESDEDIGVSEKSFSSAVVSGTDWTTETIIGQIDKGNIQLNPHFQRRDAWDKIRKSKFIESLIMGLPVPQLVLAESKTKRGAYIVLDGKQRLLSIRQFAAKEGDESYEQLKLKSLEIRSDLNNYSLESLKNKGQFLDDVSAFENQAIRTVVIKNWPDEDFLYHVFLRLNTGSVSLSPQELRQALHPGPFVTFLDTQSSESVALRQILKLTKPDFRMRDAELLLRYFSFRNFLQKYTGSLKVFLDDCCKELNADWDEKQPMIQSQLQEFEQIHLSVRAVFGENSYMKWSGNGYENRFNRAIFDIMLFGFESQDIRQRITGRELEIEQAFKELCQNDAEFLSSIESTTKSLGATQTRISKWANRLNDVLNVNMPIPHLVNNRIVY